MTCVAVLADVYDRLSGRPDATVRKGTPPLRRIHVIRHLAMAIVVQHWDEQDGRVPRPADAVTAESRRRIEGLLEAHWPVLIRLREVGTGAMAEAVVRLRAHGIDVAPRALSEPVAVRVGGEYRRTGRLPAEVNVADGVVTAQLVRGPDPLPIDEFRKEFGTGYDEEWAGRGAAALIGFRPSSVGLGPDSRPPLTPTPGLREPAGGWQLGLRRSVYSRYRLFTDGSARSRTANPADPGCDHHAQHETLRRLACADTHELGLQEIRRSCSPYGLAMAEHAGVLLAIGQALVVDESASAGGGRERTWDHWADVRCAPLAVRLDVRASASEPDTGLVAALRDFPDLWRRTSRGRLTEQQYGPIAAHAELMVTAVARKTWMELHRREREYVHPVRRGPVVKAIRLGFDVALKEALQQGGITDPAPPDRAVTPAPPSAQRRDRTCAFLYAYADEVTAWRLAAMERDLSWTPRYEEIIGSAPGPREDHLTIEELTRILLAEWSDDDDAE